MKKAQSSDSQHPSLPPTTTAGLFRKFDDLHPVVAVRANFDEVSQWVWN